mgnify:FL=1
MGSIIEINDTLKISKQRGFPADLTLEQHVEDSSKSRWFLNKRFKFLNPDERLYHRPPARVFLVEEVGDRWLYWGNAFILEQTIGGGETSGVYEIVKIYDPEFQRKMTVEESPKGKSYFPDEPTSLLTE